MKKEIVGICLLFLVVFTLISLLSYSDTDPSVFHNSGVKGNINNQFGIIGAHISGLFIGFFGLGAFWIPFLFLLTGIVFLVNIPTKPIWPNIIGGFLLVILTGSLLALKQSHYVIWGNNFYAGGIIGTPLTSLFVEYANDTGAFIILTVLWIIAFMLATGFSFIVFFKRCFQLMLLIKEGFHLLVKKIKERFIKWRTKRITAPQKAKKVTLPIPLKPDKLELKEPLPEEKIALDLPQKQTRVNSKSDTTGFQLPPTSFLDESDSTIISADDDHLQMQSQLLENKLTDFGVKGKVTAILPGPVITTFEYEPAPGIKINKIVNLADDLALALKAISIRIVAPIPGKSVIGVEIPNKNREMVRFKEMVMSESFRKSTSKLTMCLGKDIVGNPVSAQLEKMPHLLIAGATGAGKSVALNTMISSFLYKASPDDVKMVLVDPKRIELSLYDGIPHLITPVVTDVKKATNALFWAVKEMERRYELLSETKARNIHQYNQKIEKEKKSFKIKAIAGGEESEPPLEPLPLIVIIIDELADLMMVASRDVEVALARLAQMARAAGIHIILATQRPSVDVLTGLIKANFPTRMTFKVSSKIDSRTIIDMNGAENLLGNGDMLFLPPGTSKLQRIHGAYISESELIQVIEFLKAQGTPDYDQSVQQTPEKSNPKDEEREYDEHYDAAVALVTKTRQTSISMIQRHFRIGYNRAARIIEVMEEEGIVGPSDGVKPREVLVQGYDDILP
jgi:S-DNA-T family DNA segregation ATPase FtsK/SpoIIIE